jgi:hypothetical protein
MAGPSNTLLAIAAAGVTAAGSRQRHLSQEEYDWAKKKVFAESLPPIQDIILIDTIGARDRAFTFAAPLGKITLNIGLEAFDDPRTCYTTKGRQYGETFIHKLTHVWQIHYTSMSVSLMANAIANQTYRQASYKYRKADITFRDFNLEQQAEIVADWALGI